MSKNNGFGKVLLWAIIGAIVGYGIPKSYNVIQTLQETYNIKIIWYIVPLLFILALILYFKSVKQFNDMNRVTDLSEDEQFIYQVSKHNKTSANVVNAYNVLFLSFCLSLTILINPSTMNLIIFFVYLVICIFVLVIIKKHNHKVIAAYPTLTNRDVSIDYNDMQLMENVIDAVDEGERLVMLHSLTKTYQTMIVMLSVILMLLGLYQAGTGENQYLAMFAITGVLIYSTSVYYKKNEEFNK
ncbi:DUF3169 family protein [Macrococcoides canis]|uniref:DUF3169 family protein n=1 Tax=Macrococcoides canis TaxID=1855823 RepID=UPI001F22DA87|nr:DUF3169 family protein [Macrococcus canis]UJS27475.1 DUF3169 family protein [Macrococcus canis]UTG99791.1 DUF3169 family protein [Macrococcus canis]WBF53218.1 DUF3169 family protein [Macrococcus canis]